MLSILKIDEVNITQDQEEALRQELGLHKPVFVQYADWLGEVARLDLGDSYVNDSPVVQLLLERLPATLMLTLGGIVVMLAIAFPLGTLAARSPGSLTDRLCQLLAWAGASIPGFLLGLLLIYFIAYRLDWLPTMGMGSVAHIVLPSLTLGFSMAAVYMRLLRGGLLDSLSQEYIRAARARGLGSGRIMMNHAMRAALPPVVTVFGMSIGSMLAGTVVVEVLFAWPGLGSMAVDAVFQRDYPVIQGYVLLTGSFVVLIQLLVDLAYRWLDPRIRYGKGELR